ncbi:MAG: hypothetical protein AAFR81_18400 [Chloroflexota bacterium]
MNKRKQAEQISAWHRLLRSDTFEHSVSGMPRLFTREMSSIVCYPELINDVGRTVDVRRQSDNRYAFHIKQKRYLGRGSYAISGHAIGTITYDEASDQTHIAGYVRYGGQYAVLLTIMSTFVALSLPLILFTILYLPLALLMLAVLALHWAYLRADQKELLHQLAQTVAVAQANHSLAESSKDTINNDDNRLLDSHQQTYSPTN